MPSPDRYVRIKFMKTRTRQNTKVLNMLTQNENPLLGLDQPELAKLFAATAKYAFESILITTAGSDDAGYSIAYGNPAFTAMTGYEAHEAIGKSPGILQGPKTDVGVLERLSSDLHAGQQFHGQAINYRKDSSEFMLERNSSGKLFP